MRTLLVIYSTSNAQRDGTFIFAVFSVLNKPRSPSVLRDVWFLVVTVSQSGSVDGKKKEYLKGPCSLDWNQKFFILTAPNRVVSVYFSRI
jgi:hypothetical protein